MIEYEFVLTHNYCLQVVCIIGILVITGKSAAYTCKVPLCVQSERSVSYMARHGGYTAHCN